MAIGVSAPSLFKTRAESGHANYWIGTKFRILISQFRRIAGVVLHVDNSANTDEHFSRY
jgi:hypothetical protein